MKEKDSYGVAIALSTTLASILFDVETGAVISARI